ncbi:MAG: hypothetical protein QOD30_1856 [Actinomycetota bacterium]|jgi:hypothetical protein|nr:hypothetical protein [Actinomycetota bacterium]
MTMFTCDDLELLSESVAAAWTSGIDRDWSRPAGSVEWTCTKTADHAVDCVIAPAVFLASRRTDAYPAGGGWSLGTDATPATLIEALHIVTHLHVALVSTTDPSVRAILWRRPSARVAPPADFPPRAGLELALHAHDVCAGLGVPFAPPPDVAANLRSHTREWPFWDGSVPGWSTLTDDADAWADLLRASGRTPISPA